jgi:LysM repeat protein
MRYCVSLFIGISWIVAVKAQPSERRNSPDFYIQRYKDDAVREMQMSHVPASITIAQGMLESDHGNSALAVYANNHFGIKCHADWTGETYVQDDDARNECFRKYESVYDSYLDHSKFIRQRERYAELFKLQITDYKGWARGLKASGYATDPRYAERLIEIIERYKLYELDKLDPLPAIVAQPEPTTRKQQAYTAVVGREVLFNNGVKYIVIKSGDTFYSIAREFELDTKQLYKYNDLEVNAVLKAGQVLYIQSKRKRSRVEKEHTVKPTGETLYEIAQHYGIRISSLYKYNQFQPGVELKPGQVVYLRKRR